MITKTPESIQIVADDLDTTTLYDAPSEPYDGVAALARPPAGTIATGFNPGQSTLFGAQSLNAIGQAQGRALDAAVDVPSFQHERLPFDSGDDRLDYSNVDGDDANTNTNAGDPPLLMVTEDGWVHALLEHLDAGAGRTRKWHPGAGKGYLGDAGVDVDAWTLTTASGLTPAETGRALVLAADRNSEYLLALGSGRDVEISNNRGATWVSSTDLPANANWTHPLAAVALPDDRWLVCDYIPTTTHVNRVVVSANLDASSWTELTGTVAGGDDGGPIRRITYNAQTAIFLPAMNTRIGRWVVGETEVSTVVLADPDNTRTRWRGAWNEQIGRFMIGNAQGDLWVSDASGETWTQVEIEGFGVADIVAHGRGFVVSNADDPGLWFVRFDMHGNVHRDLICKAFQPGVSAACFHLASAGGRWFAGRINAYAITGGAGSLRYVLEPIVGGVSPWDVSGVVGR